MQINIKYRKNILIGILAFIVVGCSTAQPNRASDGNYYMSGDADCKYGTTDGRGRMMCYKADRKTATGYRYAMTQADMQMYMYRQQQNQAAVQNLNNSINSMNAQIQQNNAMMMQSTQNMISNQNYNWNQPQRKTTYCHRAGNFITCN